jgi:UrcA family protein
MKIILVVLSVATLASAAGAEPLGVVERDDHLTLRVTYDDLNLRSASGRDRLNKRVSAAVRTICRNDNPGLLVMKMAEQRCSIESLRSANEQIKQALNERSISLASAPQAIETMRR